MGRSLVQVRPWAAAAALALAAVASAPPALAVSIELNDVAPDRIERQRAAEEGALPLPGTPDLAQFKERLAEKGVKPGDPIYIRVFKAESELEVWVRKDAGFVLFATYPICHWSGTIGPKVKEGDKQTPEGFYSVRRRQLHRSGRWPQALNLGFPNLYDKAQSRTGSYLLVHGGCSSVGCFAMTNTVIEEIFELSYAALKQGQDEVPVHVFPFRMTQANLDKHKHNEWMEFWRGLKQGYDSFERTRRPPRVVVCENHYLVMDAPVDAGGERKTLLQRLGLSKSAAGQACPKPEMVATVQSEMQPQAAAIAGDATAGAKTSDAATRSRAAAKPARTRSAQSEAAGAGGAGAPGADVNTMFSDAR